MQKMACFSQLMSPKLKGFGVLALIGLISACDNHSKNVTDKDTKPVTQIEQNIPVENQTSALSYKLESLSFTLSCGNQSCPDIKVMRLNTNYPELDVAVDRYIYNYMSAFLQGFDLAEPVLDLSNTTQESNKSPVQNVQEIKSQQNNIEQAVTEQSPQTKLILEQQVQPYVNKFIALSTEVKSLGSPVQLSLFIKPQVLNDKGPVNTVVINANNYVGGAHGSSAQQYINFELASKKVLNLDNIIQPAKRKELNDLVYQKFQAWVKDAQPDTDFAEYESLWSFKLSNNFYLSPQGLVFQYGEYEIGPYVVGLPRLVVPYTELETILKTEYLPQHSTKQNKPQVKP